MNIFLKPSYRLAADEFLGGSTKTEACRKAGFKQPKHAAVRIFSREDVRIYVEQKQVKLAKAHDTTKADVAARCWEILDINPIDLLVRDEKGDMRIDLGAVKESSNRIFKSGAVELTETHVGRKVTYTVKVAGLAAAKTKALDTLCRMYGFYEDSMNVKGEISIAEALIKGRERLNSE